MTVNQRIHDQAFCYDAELPPSIPAGEPLRASVPAKSKARRSLRKRFARRAVRRA